MIYEVVFVVGLIVISFVSYLALRKDSALPSDVVFEDDGQGNYVTKNGFRTKLTVDQIIEQEVAEQKDDRIYELESLLSEINKDLLEFSSIGKIENLRSKIKEVLEQE